LELPEDKGVREQCRQIIENPNEYSIWGRIHRLAQQAEQEKVKEEARKPRQSRLF